MELLKGEISKFLNTLARRPVVAITEVDLATATAIFVSHFVVKIAPNFVTQ